MRVCRTAWSTCRRNKRDLLVEVALRLQFRQNFEGEIVVALLEALAARSSRGLILALSNSSSGSFRDGLLERVAELPHVEEAVARLLRHCLVDHLADGIVDFGLISETGGGLICRIASNTSASVAPSNGRRRVSAS